MQAISQAPRIRTLIDTNIWHDTDT